MQMNEQELNRMHRESFKLLDWKSYRPVEGVIRWSKSESWEHYIAKCVIVRLLKEGIFFDHLEELFVWNHFITEKKIYWTEVPLELFLESIIPLKNKLKKYEIPKIFTEARFSKRLIADVFVAASLEGRAVIEIADTETEKELERKKRNYMNMRKDIKFLVIRI